MAVEDVRFLQEPLISQYLDKNTVIAYHMQVTEFPKLFTKFDTFLFHLLLWGKNLETSLNCGTPT